MRALVGVALAGVVVFESGCFCTNIGCGSVASIEVVSVPDEAALMSAKLDVCFNDECFSADLPTASQLSQGTTVTVNVYELQYADHVAVKADFDGIADPHDGDLYVVDLAGADGATITTQYWIASSYEHTRPNGPGPGCDTECLHAELTPRM
jgi:hypothetical protein